MATPAPNTLLGLAPELRLAIFNHIFLEVQVDIERGEERVEKTVTTWERDEDDDNDLEISFEESAKRAMSVPPPTPEEIIILKLVCRDFNREIGDSWHSQVTYYFPSTVSFIDVLSQWSKGKLETVRHIHVCDSPLPLYPIDSPDCYHTHDFNAALPLFPGLALDSLTVENIWLHPNGEERDGWCLGATFHALKELVSTSGWKNLYYYSGILGFRPDQVEAIENEIATIQKERNEPDYTHTFARIRPQLDGLVTHHPDGTTTSSDTADMQAAVDKWYADHPEIGPQNVFPDDVQSKGIAFTASRGRNAKYTETGEGLGEVLKGLMGVMTWRGLRETDEYLVDDGLDNTLGHL